MITLLLLMMFAGRQYHSVSIEKMAANRHTHVEVVGYVTFVKWEEDHDIHLRICTAPRIKGMDRKRCIVAEEIPTVPEPMTYDAALALKGKKVRVRGISRYDKEAGHLWEEIHPLEGLEILR